MLFLMVETFSKDGIKIGLFPIEFIKKIIYRKMSKKKQIWTKLNGRKGVTPPSVHLIIRGDVFTDFLANDIQIA